MSNEFKTPITIRDAITNIQNGTYLLPAIQREFTWSCEQIELLFDSIMQGYPINTFMFWNITDDKIKKNYVFYRFLDEYREYFKKYNPQVKKNSSDKDFKAVIDGQQRLNSLFIGLKGSYAYKLPRKFWKDDEAHIPTRRLYLNLKKNQNVEIKNQKKYDFRFLTQNELNLYNDKNKYCWFQVGQILNLDTQEKLIRFNIENKIEIEEQITLSVLWAKIYSEKLINYYEQEDQDPDKVLEIFLRANSGGTPLTFSDLLMSISSANWKAFTAKEEFQNLINEIYNNESFMINKDFILKTCLYLCSDNIKFQLKNFTEENVKKFEDNWNDIKKSIISAFKLFKNLGFNNTTFRAKNAALPIIWYIYNNDLEEKILKTTYNQDDKKNIKKWLSLSFLKSIFGGTADNVLTKFRNILKNNDNCLFPFNKIVEEFKSDQNKNYNFDDEFLDGLLCAQKDSNEAYYALLLLYPGLHFEDKSYHQDHLHPETTFTNKKNFDNTGIPDEEKDFALKRENWNSIKNIQLLDGLKNESKNKTSLKDWTERYKYSCKDLFVDENTSLDIKDFKKFILNRERNIKKMLKEAIEN